MRQNDKIVLTKLCNFCCNKLCLKVMIITYDKVDNSFSSGDFMQKQSNSRTKI